jgi:hypothetical protein
MCQIDWDAKNQNRASQTKLVSQKKQSLSIAIFLGLQLTTLSVIPSKIFAETNSLPNYREDPPEEVLRAEIYTDARSPIDGKQLTAAEYVELMEKLRSLDNIPPEDFVSPKVREVIDLLRLRKFLRQFIPFIP